MAKRDCNRESEVLAGVASGVLDAELRAHVDVCENCRDLFDVARAVVEDRTTLMREAHLPGAGLVWWRATMREKRETARVAVRTGRVIQFALVVAAIVIALGILGISVDVHAAMHSVARSARMFAVPLIALAAWLILAPVAVYFAVTEK